MTVASSRTTVGCAVPERTADPARRHNKRLEVRMKSMLPMTTSQVRSCTNIYPMSGAGPACVDSPTPSGMGVRFAWREEAADLVPWNLEVRYDWNGESHNRVTPATGANRASENVPEASLER